MARRALPRSLVAVIAMLASALSVAGCVTIPDGGPVYSYPITQGLSAANQPYPQLIPKPPQPGASPEEIVRGFLTATASFADGQRVAREFLTATASRAWRPRPAWSATVFKSGGPQVGQRTWPEPGNQKLVTITVSGKVQAELSSSGAYAVPSASGDSAAFVTFTLVKDGGQWRISSRPPSQLLLTSTEFAADYQLRNLYFLDPQSRSLVPDPVYVPLRTTPVNLLNGLVRDLIKPPGDWLSYGTQTAFPPGTRLLSDVMVNGGAAAVPPGGAAGNAGDDVKERISAQLLSTLSGTGQGQPLVHSVVLDIDGKPWSPPRAQQNPVQHSAALRVPDGSSADFYYLTSKGALERRPGTAGSPVKVNTLGKGYSAIAVSPDNRYLAALRHGTLYTGTIGGTLLRRAGSGYTTMSWDNRDQLWTTENGSVFMLRGEVTARSPQALAAPEPVMVVRSNGLENTSPITAVRVAPDGVRVAFITLGTVPALAFGAISAQAAGPPQDQMPSRSGPIADGVRQVRLSPFSVFGGPAGFSSVSWYGADNVVTIGTPAGAAAPRLTEYAVNGASSTTITTEAGIQSVTTSAGRELIAGATGGMLLANETPTGAWGSAGAGLAPAYPG